MIVEYCQADKMGGLVALQVDISVDEQYESVIYSCKFSEAANI